MTIVDKKLEQQNKRPVLMLSAHSLLESNNLPTLETDFFAIGIFHKYINEP